MEEKNLEELAKKIAEQQGISMEEAAYMILGVMEVAGSVVEVWGKLRKFDIRQTWSMIWDTRKKSQVILNKPKFAVRKIIK